MGIKQTIYSYPIKELAKLKTTEYVYTSKKKGKKMKSIHKNLQKVHSGIQYLGILFVFPALMSFIDPVFAENEENLVSTSGNIDSIQADAVNDAQRGKYPQAIKKFQDIVSIQDQNVAATYNNLGYTFLLNNDYQNAIENFKKAIERNPGLVPALANLGKMLYQVGNYQDAITYGERTISLDPQNPNVREWLPDAYKKAADKRMYDLQNMKIKVNNTEGEKKEGSAIVIPKKPESRIELNGLLELGWDKSGKKLFFYGPTTNIPFPVGFLAELWASPEVQITGQVKIPNMGLNLPYFISSEEDVKFIFHTKESYYGIGIYFSQANFGNDLLYSTGEFIHNSDYPRRNDTKLGFVIGSHKEFNSFIFYTYPRFLFQDMAKGPQSIEFDRSLTKIEYRIVYPEDKKRELIPWHFEIAMGMKIDEYFITEYNTAPSDASVGHYFGIYDLYVNFAFGKIQQIFDKIPFQLGFILGTRFYFQELDDPKPFTFGNGQGYFGFDSNGALSGKAFPTYNHMCFIFDIYAKQMFLNKLVVMEKIGTELPTKTTEPYNGFSAAISVSYTF